MAESAETTTASVPGRREQRRITRTRDFLESAFRIVFEEGFEALTMQRLADENDAAIGAVYRYFPSKGALVAEVQRTAIDRLGASYTIIRDRSDRFFAERELEGPELATARLVLFGRWFIATADTFPQEMQLLQMAMTEWKQIFPPEDGMRVLPSAMRLLDQARTCMDEAVAAGAVDDADDSISRVVTWAAAVGGVLQLTRLGPYDAELFDGQALARTLTGDLLRAWGVSAEALAHSAALVDDLADTGPLAPPLPVDAY